MGNSDGKNSVIDIYKRMGSLFFDYDMENDKLKSHKSVVENEIKFSGYSVKLIEKVDENNYVPSKGFLYNCEKNTDVRDAVIIGVLERYENLNRIIKKGVDNKVEKMISNTKKRLEAQFNKTIDEYKKQTNEYLKQIKQKDREILNFKNENFKLVVKNSDTQGVFFEENKKLKEENTFLIEKGTRYFNKYKEDELKLEELGKKLTSLKEKVNELETDKHKLGEENYKLKEMMKKEKVNGSEEDKTLIQELEKKILLLEGENEVQRESYKQVVGLLDSKDSEISELRSKTKKEPCMEVQHIFNKDYNSLQISLVNGKERELKRFRIYSSTQGLFSTPLALYKIYKKESLDCLDSNILTPLKEKLLITYSKESGEFKLTEKGREIIEELIENKPELFESLK